MRISLRSLDDGSHKSVEVIKISTADAAPLSTNKRTFFQVFRILDSRGAQRSLAEGKARLNEARSSLAMANVENDFLSTGCHGLPPDRVAGGHRPKTSAPKTRKGSQYIQFTTSRCILRAKLAVASDTGESSVEATLLSAQQKGGERAKSCRPPHPFRSAPNPPCRCQDQSPLPPSPS